jgi:predicted ATPase with chaperone activity
LSLCDSSSDAVLDGGGFVPRPGEISFAHYDVLFLDEIPEFTKNVLEVLRQPFEDGSVTLVSCLGRYHNQCPTLWYSSPYLIWQYRNNPG